MRKVGFIGVMLALVSLAAGCAAPAPVLYPNAHLQSVGQQRAEQDIADCRTAADAYVRSNPAGTVAGSTAAGAAGGALIGGAVGAVTGDLGRGAAIGAAGGGASGLLHGGASARQKSPTYRSFVDRCLAEKGYEVIGWE